MESMGWFKNQQARNKAKKAGEAMPRTGGLADRMTDAVDAKVNESREREQRVKEATDAVAADGGTAGDVLRAARDAAKKD